MKSTLVVALLLFVGCSRDGLDEQGADAGDECSRLADSACADVEPCQDLCAAGLYNSCINGASKLCLDKWNRLTCEELASSDPPMECLP